MTADPTQPPAEEAPQTPRIDQSPANGEPSDGSGESAKPDDSPRQDAPPDATDQPSADVAEADRGPAAPPPKEPPLRRIRIGARRSGAGKPRASTKPLATRPDRPVASSPDAKDGEETSVVDLPEAAPRGQKTPLPSAREPLPEELEREIDAVLRDGSLHGVATTGHDVDAGDALEVDSRHEATVVKIHGDNVFFSMGGRDQGVVSLRQFREAPVVGNQMEVVVRGYQADDGLYELAVPGASVDVQDWSDLAVGAVVEARITGSNTGGLECQVGNIRGFIPNSQVEMVRVENYADYYEKKLLCVVTEANKRRRNLVLSHRAVLEREKEEQRKQRLEELEPGQVLEGVVSSIRDFGAFVDIGGLDGLVHISRLSWDRVEHPSEVLEVGQRVRVKVEKVNRQTGKVGLSYRDLLEHPWTNVEERFPPNAIVKGTVTRTAQFGAFVKLAPGVEGLVHISELAHHRVVDVSNVVREGDQIEVKVLSVDPEAQRIALSLKEAHAVPVAEGAESPDQHDDQPPRQPAAPKRHSQLKGGMDRGTGGEEFGLKW